jgi:hypothetical protein
MFGPHGVLTDGQCPLKVLSGAVVVAQLVLHLTEQDQTACQLEVVGCQAGFFMARARSSCWRASSNHGAAILA